MNSPGIDWKKFGEGRLGPPPRFWISIDVNDWKCDQCPSCGASHDYDSTWYDLGGRGDFSWRCHECQSLIPEIAKLRRCLDLIKSLAITEPTEDDYKLFYLVERAQKLLKEIK